MQRTRKSPEQRAQETLDAAMRRAARAHDRVKALTEALGRAVDEAKEATEHADYAAKNPALGKEFHGEYANEPATINQAEGNEQP